MHRRGVIRPRQIGIILRIPGRVTLIRQILLLARLDVVRRDALSLEREWGFDDSGEEAGSEMPVNMAMEGPDTWIVGSESIDEIATCLDFHYVSSSWCGRGGGCWRAGILVWSGEWWRALDHLEVMAVHVDWVAAGVAIVDHDFDNVVVAYDVGICVLAIDDWIGGFVAGVKDCVESRNFRFYVRITVDGEARTTVNNNLLQF